MAVIVADSRNGSYNGNISTANGFYRAESANLATWGGQTAINTSPTLAITPLNAGNSMGVQLWVASNSTTTTRSITVELQENVASVWTTRQSATRTAASAPIVPVAGAGAGAFAAGHCLDFKFAAPYAVTTAAGTWRLRVTQGAGTGEWSWRFSSAGNFSHAFWCDNQVSYVSNTDQFVATDTIILNQATTLAGALFTGDAVTGVAGWVGSSSDRTSAVTISKLVWADAPASSYTVTVKGMIVLPAYGGFRAGTEALPIPSASMGILDFSSASVGTSKPMFVVGSALAPTTRGNSGGGGQNIYIWGEVPAVEDTELETAASAGASVIRTKVSTGWAINDQIMVGRCVTKGNPDATMVYTITAIAGQDITITPNIATARAINASVIRFNGYGFRMISSDTSGFTENFLFSFKDFYIKGCEFLNVGFYGLGTGAVQWDALYKYTVKNCSGRSTGSSITAIANMSGGFHTNVLGEEHDHVNTYRMVPTRGYSSGNGQFAYSITNCIAIQSDATSNGTVMALSGISTVTDNKCENCVFSFFNLTGTYNTFRRNKIWGNAQSGGAAQGAVRINGLFLSTDMGDNYYDNNLNAIIFNGVSMENKFKDDFFSTATANTTDIWVYFRAFAQVVFENYTGNAVLGFTPPMLSGSNVRLVSKNKVIGDDEQRKAEGTIFKAGTGLADTTKHVGDYCMKFVPIPSYEDLLEWRQSVPTENIQNKDMMVGVWINIANSAYWAGAHQMPRLNVNYDNGTIAYAEAAQVTGWQFLFVPISPVTTFGQLTVYVNGKTSASTANGVFYVADMSVLYPAGHTLALGAMNTWADAGPVEPSISTSVSAADVWAADPTQFGASTVGDKVNKIKKIVTGLQ